MQGEIHGLAFPACTTVPQLPVTSVACVTSISSFSSLSVTSGESFLAQSCESDRPLMALIAGDGAVADSAVTTIPNRHSQDLVLEIAHRPMESVRNFLSPKASLTPRDVTEGANSMMLVVGHRGCGKNKTVPLGGIPEAAMSSIRENTITSFNLAARNGAQFVEFDVQVTKDGVPIIFHDDVIITDPNLPGRHIGDITLEQFRAMGPQKDASKVGQALYRQAVDKSVSLWTADVEDSMCTLEEAFREVQPSVGFNIELKFDDSGITAEAELHRVIDAVLEDVRNLANGRMIYFSSFHPDAVHILRQKSPVYPVFFLTDGGTDERRNKFIDERRNSIEAAVEVCRKGNLQGIVSEVRAVLHGGPACVALAKAQGLFFFTYGELNNVGEAVLKQQRWGIDGVIVDHVLEMVRVARHMDESSESPSNTLARRSVSVDLPLSCKYEEMIMHANKKKKEEQGKKDWKRSAMKIISHLIHFLYKL